MKLLAVLMLVFVGACNSPADKNGQGYRENQEEVMAPNDYTSGKDSKNEPQTRR